MIFSCIKTLESINNLTLCGEGSGRGVSCMGHSQGGVFDEGRQYWAYRRQCVFDAGRVGLPFFLFLFDDDKEAEEDKGVKSDVTKYSISIFSSFFAHRNSLYTDGV